MGRDHLVVGGEGIRIRGRLSLTVLCPDGSVRDYREGDNLICTTGFTVLAAALVWAGIQDQASALGVTTPTYLTPLFGAVGSSGVAPAKSDTQLGAELGRQAVGAGAASPATPSIAAQATWLFYFPQPASTWTVTEAGLFANATSAANSGTMIDHWAFSPSVSVSTSDTLLLQVSLGAGP